MPKFKTRTAAKKRFKITKTGKVLRGHQYGRHRKSRKTNSRSRRHKEPAKLTGRQARTIKRMLGHG